MSTSQESNTDKFAAAMSHARNAELERSTNTKSDTETFATNSVPTSKLTPTDATPAPSVSTPALSSAATSATLPNSTSSAPTLPYAQSSAQSLKRQSESVLPTLPTAPERPTEYAQSDEFAVSTQSRSDESELSRLRALLLGTSHKDQQNQVNAVYERTQTGINELRQDMDTRLDNLTKYVGQLEQSILNSIEVRAEESDQQQWAVVAESTEARVQEHNDRIDAFDARLTSTLSNLRAEFEADREADRANLKKELAEANARTDKLLENVSSRLETSIASIEERLSKQLTNQSAGLVVDSESSVSNLRTQLGNLIDDRVRAFNDKQTSGLGELRDILLANTQQLNSELQSQTEQQRSTLNSHRVDMENQLNSAIHELNQSKVSHKDLAMLLGRLADRLKHL